MKASNFPPLASFLLKLAGITLILLYLLDFLVLLLFAKFQDNQWLLTFSTQLVDRGFLPLIGLALLLTGFWVENAMNTSAPEESKGLRLAALLLSSVLALLFLLLVPVNINSTRVAADDQVKQIGQQASQAEGQLDAQVQQAKAQVDVQLASIDQAIKSGQVPADQLAQAQQRQAQLRKLKDDPKALDAQLAPARQEAEKIRGRKQELETQTRENATRSGLRIGLSGLVLAVAHAAIGWTGLRRML